MKTYSLEGKTYSIIRSPAHDWNAKEIVASNKDYNTARKMVQLLTDAHDALTARPGATSWSSDQFYPQMEPFELPKKKVRRRARLYFQLR